MSSFRVFNRSVGRIISTVALVAAAVVPSFLPAMASAAQVTGRSIALSSSSKGATGVTYNVTFTPATSLAAGSGIAVDFCQESPIIADTCTGPTGFSASSAATSTSGYTIASSTANRVNVAVTGATTSGTPVNVAITGITNPSAAGQFYARILTYTTSANATGDASATKETGTGVTDTGGVALSATDTVSVSGTVLEKLVFCVGGAYTSASPFATACGYVAGATSGNSAPTLHLGTQTGSFYVLGTTTPDTGNIYTQLTTNAVSGAVVSLKNSVTCGGMARLGAVTCDIPALGTVGSGNGFTSGTAGFGVIANADTAADASSGMKPSGAFQIATGSTYSSTTYRLNSAAVTGTYGDPILDTNGSQTADRNMILTFGAQAGNNTPAGTYSADLSLVATGKF